MRRWMWIALAAAVGAALWAGGQDDDEGLLADRGGKGRVSPAQQGRDGQRPASPGQGRRQTGSVPGGDRTTGKLDTALIAGFSRDVAQWQARVAWAPMDAKAFQPWGSARPPVVPPPPAPPPPPPPPPMAPPFPHAWLGRFDTKAIVAGPSSTWVLGVGEVIEGQWRIDQISERQMKLTYLPLQQQQAVAMKAP